MRVPLVAVFLFLPACNTANLSTIDVHARPSIFAGTKLPPIDVSPGVLTRVRYFDADYNEVAAADRPGRYGAIVQLNAGRQSAYRFLTLFRTPSHLDWDGARLDLHARFSPPFGIADAVADAQRESLGEFFKFALHQSARSETNESNWQAAAVIAGLYESSNEATPQPFVQRHGFAARDQRWWFGLKKKLGLPRPPYVLRVPPHAPDARLPMIVFLHGSGEAGDGGRDLDKVRRGGFPGLDGSGASPADGFIVLAPQAPPQTNWSPYEVMDLIDQVAAQHPVDRNRIYLTGLSLGGYGVWDTAMAFPDRFAAIAPVAGAGDPADVARLSALPVWIFHGADDPTVPVFEARRMIDALTAAGHPPRVTIFPGVGHGSWAKAYADAELYRWFLSNMRR